MKKLILGFLLLVGLVSSSVAGPATKAYYWDVRYVSSNTGGWENTYGKYSTTENHGGTVKAYVLIGGYTNSVVATFNGSAMQLTWTSSIDFNGDGIVDGWWYEYTGYGQSGTIEIKDMKNYRWGTQDRIYVK